VVADHRRIKDNSRAEQQQQKTIVPSDKSCSWQSSSKEEVTQCLRHRLSQEEAAQRLREAKTGSRKGQEG